MQVAASTGLKPSPELHERYLRRNSLDSVVVVTFPSTLREFFFAISEHMEMDFYALCMEAHAFLQLQFSSGQQKLSIRSLLRARG